MLLYAIAGTLGPAYFVVMMSVPEGWLGLYLISTLTSAIGWVPGAFLLVIYRHSWRVVMPAAILIGCLGFLLHFGFADDSTITLALLFYVALFLIGTSWFVQKAWRSRREWCRC
jgi:hypothetical protein